MRTAIDRIGKRFGRLVVIARAGSANNGGAVWLCRCDCGREAPVSAKNLARLSEKKKCGMPARYRPQDKLLCGVWRNMQSRCYDPASRHYHRYGGRGITICKEWQCPTTFVQWARANGYRKGLQLDRRDNNKGYSPENCRFVTSKVNNRNRENNRLVKWRGEEMPLAELAEKTGVGCSTLDWRIRKMGMSAEDAVSLPRDIVATRRWAQANL